jgi:hypothetical protein
MVARLVARLGPKQAISAVIERLRRTPFGDLFPVENLRRVAEAMVNVCGKTSRSGA